MDNFHMFCKLGDMCGIAESLLNDDDEERKFANALNMIGCTMDNPIYIQMAQVAMANNVSKAIEMACKTNSMRALSALVKCYSKCIIEMFHVACANKKYSIAEWLIHEKHIDNNTALIVACETGYLPIAQLLIKYRVPIDADHLCSACRSGSLELFNYITLVHVFELQDIYRALIIAVQNNHIDIFRKILHSRPDLPKQKINHAYQAACYYGREIMINELINNEVDHFTALQNAINAGNADIAFVLLRLTSHDKLKIPVVNHALLRKACEFDMPKIISGLLPQTIQSYIDVDHINEYIKLSIKHEQVNNLKVLMHYVDKNAPEYTAYNQKTLNDMDIETKVNDLPLEQKLNNFYLAILETACYNCESVAIMQAIMDHKPSIYNVQKYVKIAITHGKIDIALALVNPITKFEGLLTEAKNQIDKVSFSRMQIALIKQLSIFYKEGQYRDQPQQYYDNVQQIINA